MGSALPVQATEVTGTYELRCHSCSHGVGFARETMRFVAMFKASLFGRMSAAPEGERRARCSHCGWVNVFQPLTMRGTKR